MGRHSAPTTHWTRGFATTEGAARYVGRVGALALALGVGAAVAGGAVASAEGTTPDSATKTDTAQTANTAADESTNAVGKDPKPNGLQAALKVPRMVLGAGSGARAANALADSISTLPQRIAKLTTPDTTPNATKVTSRRATTHSAPKLAPLAAGVANSASQPDTGAPVERLVHEVAAAITPTNFTPTFAADPAVTRSVVESVSPATTLAPQLTATRPVASVVSTLLSAVGFDADGSPLTPTQSLVGALSLISRDIERAFTNAVPASQPTTGQTAGAVTPAPTPGDVVETPYGAIGAWMVKTDGDIANWGGQKYFFGTTTLLEPVNIIIVDPDSRSAAESTTKLNSAMEGSGFPALEGHSTGFMGKVLGGFYNQTPALGSDKAFSDNIYILPNNHLRAFGPAPVAGGTDGSQGYVWTGAASTEVPGIYEGTPTHRYASFGLARNVLALRMILSGKATFVGVQNMNNTYNENGVSTGDHDGYAIVLKLT